MRRLPALAFAALAAATLAAFFITQHLKVSDPLIASFRLVPGSFNPRQNHTCEINHRPVSFRHTTVSFFLPDHTDTTGVFVVNNAGNVVRTLGWRLMKRGHRGYFVWNGREQDGQLAPSGTYFVKVVLQQEGRAFDVSDHPLQIITSAPVTRVTSVTVTPIRHGDSSTHTSPTTGKAGGSLPTGAAGATVISPPHGTVTIHFRPSSYRSATIVIYRSSSSGQLTELTSYRANGRAGTATWNGRIHGRPAPAGVYMVGVQVRDAACNPGRFPTTLHPSTPTTSGTPTESTAGAGVTINYLSVEPQLYPVQAGTQATLYVNAHGSAYRWTLRRAGAVSPLDHGAVSAGPGGPLNLRVPSGAAGLDVFTVHADGTTASVPLVVSSAHGARVLVVLPALSWQGANPVDDTGDGIPDTLMRPGDRVVLNRPLVNGLPAGFGEEVALLRYLQRMHMGYQLTTDVALAEGAGPSLGGHSGVILAGPFRWIPSQVATALRHYVLGGGRVLSLGIGSLEAEAPVIPGSTRSHSGPTAGPARSLAADPFGARHGPVQALGSAILTTFSDPLGIFGQATAFGGYSRYQPIAPPSGTPAGSGPSVAGVAAQAPAIAGFHVGQGTVIEVGLSGFGAKLRTDAATRELLSRVWHLLHT